MSLAGLLDVEVRYVLSGGGLVVTAVGDVDLDRAVHGSPVRKVAAHAGQRHYSGLFWSATTGAHVPYESRLELDRLWLADFDPQVCAIAAQPLWLCGQDGLVVRRHAPALLLAHEGGGFTVVDVKPARMTDRPEVAAVFAWTGRLCAARGWRYEVWSGASKVLLSNVRWLGQARRPDVVDPGALDLIRQRGRSGMSISQVVADCSSCLPPALAVPAVLSLLWSGAHRPPPAVGVELRPDLLKGGVMGAVVELRPAVQLWFEGSLWTVQEVRSDVVLLADDQRVRSVATSQLVRAATVVTDAPEAPPDGELVAVLLGGLTARQRAALEERAAHVRELLAPADSGGVPEERYAQKAEQLGVSIRTLERWVAGYRDSGVAGLADSRLLGRYSIAVDSRMDAACLQVLQDLVDASTPTMSVVIARVARELEASHGPGVVPLPSRAAAYRRLQQLAKGRHAFGSAKARRSVAQRPQGVYGRLRAERPGEYVVLDSTPLDVFAMEPVTLRWLPVELTVAMDLFSRCILGLRLTPVSTSSRDVANVLFQCVTPQQSPDRSRLTDSAGLGEGTWPFHGVPRNVLVGSEVPDGVSQQRVGGLPACLPEAIVVDHGRQYLSAHVLGVCARLGITVQPAIVHKPTDKPTVERFFRTLREGLLQHLPAYKGPDVYSRGKDVEGQAFFYLAELEQVIREWVGSVYHSTRHAGLCVPEVPGLELSPAEMFEVGLAKTGGLLLPSRPDLAFEFLDVQWRTVQHYGVEVHGRRYNGPALNGYRNVRSPYGGVHAGKWPIFVDVHDVRQVLFRDPDSKAWHALEWEHAAGLGQPFSAAAAEYTKRIALRERRHVDPQQAVQDLLAQWSRGGGREPAGPGVGPPAVRAARCRAGRL